MLYETLLQGKIFLCMAYFGVLASLAFEVKFLILKALKQNKIINMILEILSMLFFTMMFWIAILKCNYGTFRLFELVGFCIGIAFEYFSLHKLLEKNLYLLYNFGGKITNILKKNKIFAKILK